MSDRQPLQPRTWLVWVVAASLPGLVTRNPMVLGLALLAIAVVRSRLRLDGAGRGLPMWRLGLTMTAVATLWNALTVHYGATVLLALPAWLPLIGGPITLEAIVFGLAGGLAVWLFFAAFNTFGLAVTPYQMLSLAPRAVRHAGLVVSIALAFFPQVLRTAREVREAQAVRGHRPRQVRDLAAIVVPLLNNSLEDAAQLAEAMEARGYGRVIGRATGLGWVALLAGCLIQLYWREAVVGWLLIVFGVGWLLTVGRAGQAVTRYRRERPSMADRLVVCAGLGSIAMVIGALANGSATLSYYPYPQVTLPPLDPATVIAALLLVAPAVPLRRASRAELRTPAVERGERAEAAA